MPLFGKERRRDGAGDLGRGRSGRRDTAPVDTSVLPVWTPFWSVGYHRELLRLVHAELTATGLRHSLDTAGTVRIQMGGRDTLLDVRALAHTCAVRALREWPDLVREETTRRVAAAQAAARFCEHPPPVAQAGALLALVLTSDTTPAAGRRVLAEGLAAELVYDLPSGTTAVPDGHLRSWGTHTDALWSTADDNTRTRVRVVSPAARLRGHYDVLAHGSPFTASTVLCMDELAGPVTPYGVLFGIPSRHELVAHVITDPDIAAQALRDLPNWMRRRHARAPAPLSPRLYRWHAGQVAAVPPDADVADLIGDPAGVC
ncbi:MAG TPA: hypothetical protein VIS06_04650 [Mycobacteriales bacterium]